MFRSWLWVAFALLLVSYLVLGLLALAGVFNNN